MGMGRRIDAIEEVLEGGAILCRSDQGGFLMAQAVDLQEPLVGWGRVVDGLAELEGDDTILGAVDDQDGHGGFVQARSRVELAANKELNSRKEPEQLAGQDRSGRERRFQDYRAYFSARGQVCGHGRSERLPEGDDRPRSDRFRVHEILIGSVSVAVDAGFAGLPSLWP